MDAYHAVTIQKVKNGFIVQLGHPGYGTSRCQVARDIDDALFIARSLVTGAPTPVPDFVAQAFKLPRGRHPAEAED